jgi:hypothetical protein
MVVLGVLWSCRGRDVRAVAGQKSSSGGVGCRARHCRGRRAGIAWAGGQQY